MTLPSLDGGVDPKFSVNQAVNKSLAIPETRKLDPAFMPSAQLLLPVSDGIPTISQFVSLNFPSLET